MNRGLMCAKVVAQEEEVEKEVHSDIDAPDQKEVCAAEEFLRRCVLWESDMWHAGA